MFRRGLLAITFALCAAPALAADECRTVCMPDEVRNAKGCCAPAGGQVPTTAAPSSSEAVIGCESGKSRSAETQGHCCWPNQVWGDDRCRGIPWSCPTGFHPDERAETCTLDVCAAGKIRGSDQVTCCWPGQVVANGQCRGVPTCPRRFIADKESCVPDAVLAAAEKQEAELAAVQAAIKLQQANEKVEAVEARASRRTAGYVFASLGVAGGVASGILFYASSQQFGSLKTGTFPTSAEQQAAIDTGSTFGLGARIAVIVSAVVEAIALPLIFANGEPTEEPAK